MRLLREDPPPDFPAVEYRRHFVSCERCQILLSLRQVEAAISNYASKLPPRLPHASCLSVVRKARRKAIWKRAFTRAQVSALLLLLAAAGFVLFGRNGSSVPAPNEIASAEPGVGAEDPGPRERLAEYAKGLEASGFCLRKARLTGFDGSLILSFTRSDPDADQYAFAKNAALSGFIEKFPDAPNLNLTVLDEDGKILLKILFAATEVAESLPRGAAGLPPRSFCRAFDVLIDRDTRTIHEGE